MSKITGRKVARLCLLADEAEKAITGLQGSWVIHGGDDSAHWCVRRMMGISFACAVKQRLDIQDTAHLPEM